MNSNGTTTFGEAIGQVAAENPDGPAVTCGGSTITWSELEGRSNQLADAFADAGIGTGDFVSIGLHNRPEFLVATLAVWKLGAIPQPLSSRMAPAEIAAVLDIVKPAAVIGIPSAPAVTTLPVDAPEQAAEPLQPAVSPCWKASTSGGSTGLPKVIVSETPALVERVAPIAALARVPARGTVSVPGPLHHNGPFLFATLALLAGSHVVLQERFDAEQLLRDISKHRAEWVYAVPTMMQRVSRLDPNVLRRYDVSSVQHVVHMAAPCPAWVKREWIRWLGPERILEIFSTTEGIASTIVDGRDWLERPGTVGRPVQGEIRVLDEDGREAAPGEVGHLWLRRGHGIAAGYHYLGTQHPKRLEDGWESFGDMGFFDAEGYLFLADRETDMIVVGGANVYPAEVEAALEEHPAVLSSCVIGLPHDDLGAVPHAIVQNSSNIAEEDLTAFLRHRISSYKLPRTYEYTTSPLRDDVGKVRRSALRAARLGRS